MPMLLRAELLTATGLQLPVRGFVLCQTALILHTGMTGTQQLRTPRANFLFWAWVSKSNWYISRRKLMDRICVPARICLKIPKAPSGLHLSAGRRFPAECLLQTG